MNYLNRINADNFNLYKDYIPESILVRAENDEAAIIVGINTNQTACGACAVSVGETSELMWYYVAPSMRNYGVGTDVFYDLMSLLRRKGSEELIAKLPPFESDYMRSILENYGAVITELSEGAMRVSLDTLNDTKGLKGEYSKSVSLGSVDKKLLNELLNTMVKTGNALMPMPFDISAYDEEVSAVYMAEGKAGGILLASEEDAGLTVSVIYSGSDDKESLVDMFRFFLDKAEQKYGQDSTVVLYLVQPKMTEAVNKLIKGSFVPALNARIDLELVDRAEAEVERFV